MVSESIPLSEAPETFPDIPILENVEVKQTAIITYAATKPIEENHHGLLILSRQKYQNPAT
jgi:hypothetical protein